MNNDDFEVVYDALAIFLLLLLVVQQHIRCERLCFLNVLAYVFF